MIITSKMIITNIILRIAHVELFSIEILSHILLQTFCCCVCVNFEFLEGYLFSVFDPQAGVMLLVNFCKRVCAKINNFLIMLRQTCLYVTHLYYQLWFCERLVSFYIIKSHYTSFELCYALLVYTMMDIEMRLFDDLVLEAVYFAEILIYDVYTSFSDPVENLPPNLPPKLFGPPLIEVCHTNSELKEFKVVHTTSGQKLLFLGVLVLGLVFGLTIFSTDKFFYASYWKEGEF